MLTFKILLLLVSLSCSGGFLFDTILGKNGLATFVLYTQKNARNLQGQTIKTIQDLRKSNFDGKKPTKFFIHGWFGAGTNWYVSDMRKAMLKVEDCNFFHVDWWKGSVKLSYPTAKANTKIVASEIYDLIKLMQAETGLKPSQIHLIGHSLGAQVAGAVGKRFKTEKLARISGLDPAQPGFNLKDTNETLDKSDATFVDIIHTTPIATVPMGHVDFYPSGGYTGYFKILGMVQSHLEVTYIYTASIEDKCKFLSHACADYKTYTSGSCLDCSKGTCNRMGYYASPTGALGSLYLTVTHNMPYCDVVPKPTQV